MMCIVDCIWGEWVIGECSEECNGGIRLNYREKTQQEMFNGKCEGEATYIRMAKC